MMLKEMKSQGKSFGTEANPRQQGEQTSQKTSSSKPAENEKYSYPLKRNEFMLVTSPFGMRKDPLNPANTQMHKGIDIQAKRGVHAEAFLLHGRPAEEIVRVAEDGRADLLVIGSRGLNALQELAIGSVSHKVIKHATCPVLVVK